MFVSRKSFQGGTGGNESLTFTFPVAETVSRYSINTNAVNWTLRVDNNLVDTRVYQFSKSSIYTLPAPVTGNVFVFQSNLIIGSNSLYVSNLTFTNSSGYQLYPFMESNSTFSNPIPSSEVGGVYKGLTTGGEWIQVEYQDVVPISVYSFSVPPNRYPTRWTVQGYSGSSWNTLDEQIVSTPFTTFSNSLGTSLYSKYRLTIKEYSGSTSAQISSFKLYDDAGTPFTPIMTSTTLTPTSVFLPTTINSRVDDFSPFITNSFRAGDEFTITFEIPVALYKVYIDTPSTSIRIRGDGRDILNLSNFNKIAETSVRIPCKLFRFSNFNSDGTNIILFGSKGRLNPVFTATSNTHLYGGYGTDTISIDLPPNSSNGNLYSFVGSLASWDLQGNLSGTWQTIESVSNVYSGITLPYQNNFRSTKYDGYRLVVKEIQPTPNTFYRVNCFQVVSNTFTPMIPLLNDTSTNATDTLVSTSLVGRFDVQCSDSTASGILNLFKFRNTNEVRITNSSGEKFIQITLPYEKPVTYYQMTCGNLPSDSSGGKVRLVGYLSATNSNILSDVDLNFKTPRQSLKFVTSNLTAFKTYRFVFTKDVALTGVGLDAHMPNGSILSYGNEMYSGKSNEWIQIQFSNDPGQILSYIRLESNTTIPSNVIITNYQGQELGNYVGYNATNNVNISIKTSSNIRISSRETVPNPYRYASFNLSNIGFYSSKNDKLVAPFPLTPPPDPLNNVITLSGQSLYGGLAIKEQSVYVNIYPNTTVSKYYVLKSKLARKWVIRGSEDNLTWYDLDSREITDPIVNSLDETTYIFYHNQTSNTNRSYSYFTANILETYSSTDGSVSINEFSILNDKRLRVLNLKNSIGTFPYYSGLEYKGVNRIQDNLFGDYIKWSFPKVSTFSNISISLPKDAHIQAFSLFGYNELTTIWEPIKRYSDSRKLGTYIFEGSIQNPYSAFVQSGYCNFGTTLPSNVSVTLPDNLTTIRYYKVVSSSSSLNFSQPTSWNLYADGSIVSTSGVLDSEIEISTPVSAQKYTLEITGSENQLYPVFIQNLYLYDSNKNQIYYNTDFVEGKNFQTIEKYYVNGTDIKIEFDTVTKYSNIALVVQNFLREPYESNGVADINVSFSPTPFRGVGDLYDNDTGDILSGNANVTIFSTLRNPTTATYYSFKSTNANTWTLYGSTDGVSWYVLSQNSNLITNPQPASYYKLEVSNIYYNGDGTTNISNVHIGDGILPEWPSDIMSSNLLYISSMITPDTYSTSGAQQVLTT